MRRVDTDRVEAHGDADTAGVEREEVGRQQHDGRSRIEQRTDLVGAFNANQAIKAFLAAPPEQSAFEQAAPERLEMFNCQLLAFCWREIGKAPFQVDRHDPAALLANDVKQSAKSPPDCCQHGEWQKME